MKPQCAWWGALLTAAVLMAQPQRKPFQSQGSSTITYGVKDSEETVEINNVSYQIHQRLALRKTTRWKQILGDKRADAKVTLEAWLLGADMCQKPLYAITPAGTDVHTK